MKSKNLFHGTMEKSNTNNVNIIDINYMSSLLIKSGFVQKFSFTEKQSDILNYSNMYYKILYESLEFNESITVQEITKKYGRVISSISNRFKLKCNFHEIFKQYIFYTKANISLNIFLNWLILLDLIITNFNNIFDEAITDLLEKKINLFNIDTIYEGFIGNKFYNINIDRLDYIYELMKKQPQFLNKDVESDLIILVFIFSLGNKLVYNKEITNIANMITLFELYNKMYISDTAISLLLFIDIIILINITLY